MKKYTYTDKKDTRSGFGAGMAELGRTNPKVIALCADLVASLKLDTFIKENPDRFIQCGIAEANMIGISAGLALSGYIPFPPHLQTSVQVVYMTKSVKVWLTQVPM